MAVTLFLPTVLARLADSGTLRSEGDTVGEVVANISGRYRSSRRACAMRMATRTLS